jgi:hypothetical protein
MPLTQGVIEDGWNADIGTRDQTKIAFNTAPPVMQQTSSSIALAVITSTKG